MDASKIIQPVVACVGYPVAGNPTQFVMEKAMIQLGLDWRVVTVQVEPSRFDQAIAGMRAMSFSGAFFFPPFTYEASKFCDQRTPAAKASGNVRVVKEQDGSWIGEDTLAAAIIALLAEDTLADSSALLCLGDSNMAKVLPTVEPKLASRVWTAFPEVDPSMSIPKDLEKEEDSAAKSWNESGISAIILGKSTQRYSLKKLAALPISKDCRVIFLEEDDSIDGWKSFAKQHSLPTLHSIDLSVQHYLEALYFLTGQRGSPVLIREALEEYLNW